MGIEAEQSFMSAFSELEYDDTPPKKDSSQDQTKGKDRHDHRQQMQLNELTKLNADNKVHKEQETPARKPQFEEDHINMPVPAKSKENTPEKSGNNIPDTHIGERIKAPSVAKAMHCSESELKRITDLCEKFLTVEKDSSGVALYNESDIEKIRQLLNYHAEYGLSDHDILAKAELINQLLEEPYSPKSAIDADIQKKINENTRLLFNSFSQDLKNSIRTLVQQMNTGIENTEKVLNAQTILIKNQGSMLKEQREVLSILKTRMDHDHEEIIAIKTSQKEYSDNIINSLKSSQGDMRKSISNMSNMIKELSAGTGSERTPDLTGTLSRIESSLSEQDEILKNLSASSKEEPAVDSDGYNETVLKLEEAEAAISRYTEDNQKLRSAITAIIKESDEKSDSLSQKDSQIASLTYELTVLKSRVYGQDIATQQTMIPVSAPNGAYTSPEQPGISGYQGTARPGVAVPLPQSISTAPAQAAQPKKKRKLFGFF